MRNMQRCVAVPRRCPLSPFGPGTFRGDSAIQHPYSRGGPRRSEGAPDNGDCLSRYSYNIVRWTEMPRGGHFAAFEQPELLVDDVRAFFAGLRDR